MQKWSYKLSKLAQIHLLNIKSYTVKHYSQKQWHNYKDTLISALQMLSDNPDMGKKCDDIYQNGLYFPVGRHTAYYTKQEGFILIVAVLGQSQLPQKHL